MRVEMRGETSASTASIGSGVADALSAVGCSTAAGCSSANEFQALQSGQRPSHFGDWLPHSVQEKTAAFFATAGDCSNRGRGLYAEWIYGAFTRKRKSYRASAAPIMIEVPPAYVLSV